MVNLPFINQTRSSSSQPKPSPFTMMIGEPHHNYHALTRTSTLHNPPRVSNTDPTPTHIPITPANYDAVLTALCRYIQSNEPDVTELADQDDSPIPIDSGFAATDEFRIYEFKVRPCTRSKAHDWTECPFAHSGEKARRRDPRRYSYSGSACTDFRKGSCRKGDSCEFAHGVFECWLHPARYRTQACKDGPNCTRRVCFFAHSSDQLRVVSGQPSPRSVGSVTDPFEELELSPPVTPIGRAYGSGTVNEFVASLRNLQLNKMKSMPTGSGWKGHVGLGSPRFGSVVQPGFYSLPTTPTRPVGSGYFDRWAKENEAEEPVMERVESGRELRVRMFEKLSKENPLSLPDPIDSGPDVGWVKELVK